MIEEAYVSFETAKLLKEKGFDSNDVGSFGGFYSERCYESGYGVITQSGQEVGIVYDDLTNSELDHDKYLRPTQQMAMRWLREVHHLLIKIIWTGYEGLFSWDIDNMYNGDWKNIDKEYSSYEEAVEESIKYCLTNLI